MSNDHKYNPAYPIEHGFNQIANQSFESTADDTEQEEPENDSYGEDDSDE